MKRWEQGYSLVEMLTVLAIFGTILLVTIPNLRGGYESYLVRTNTRGLASYLKLGRMRAVGENVSQIAELDASMASKCPGRSVATTQQSFVVYRENTTMPQDCYTATGGILIEAKTTGADAKKVQFRPNGMARANAPNWFLVRSRSRRQCQLVCVSALGIVRVNPITSSCTATPYGASGSTPCSAPPI